MEKPIGICLYKCMYLMMDAWLYEWGMHMHKCEFVYHTKQNKTHYTPNTHFMQNKFLYFLSSRQTSESV
jgi:hypothetical protein